MKKTLSIIAIFAMIFFVSCSKETDNSNDGQISITISALDINQVASPLSKSSDGKDVFALQIYSAEANSEQFTPYAKGLFTDWSNLSFEGASGVRYKIEATLVRDASGKIIKTGEVYGKPFNASVTNSFAYSSDVLANLLDAEATMADGKIYSVPTISRYLGIVSKNVTSEDSNIALSMKRVSFDIQNEVTGNQAEQLTVKISGAPDTAIAPSTTSTKISYSFSDILAAHTADETIAPYNETLKVNIYSANGDLLRSQDVDFNRNSLSTVDKNGVEAVEVNAPEDVPLADKITVVGDNLFYSETQLNVEQRYWVVLQNRAQEATSQKAISWYVNSVLKGTGAEFKFKPTATGEYTIKYTVNEEYSTTDESVSAEMVTKTYSSSGVYILNEPNMSASEQTRSINKHSFGSSAVERFITGDYTQFGATNQYIVNWAGKIYNVAPYPYSGIAFSQFDAVDGTFIKAIDEIAQNPMGRAFAGITPDTGVLTTSKGTYIVNLTNLTVSSAIMKGSENSQNVLVTDGYVFMITSGRAKAYKVDELSVTTEPITLGVAKTGFVQSKDGYVWAANGGTLLRIDTRDLSTQQVTLPDNAEIKFASAPWKQCPWVASTADNTFFFNKGSKEVYKYDVTTETLTAQFILTSRDMGGFNLYATSLFYDAQRDELITTGQKPGYGSNSAYNGIYLFNAKTGVKTYEVLYQTAEEGEDGYLDMWFPAMMAPIKGY